MLLTKKLILDKKNTGIRHPVQVVWGYI